MEGEARKRLKHAVWLFTLHFPLILMQNLYFFVAVFDCYIIQKEVNEQEVIDGTTLEIVEKDKTETNIVGSEEMELNIAHIFEKIEHFTQMVVTVQFSFFRLLILRIFCMKCVIHEILHVKYLLDFARLLKKPWTKRRWQIIMLEM